MRWSFKAFGFVLIGAAIAIFFIPESSDSNAADALLLRYISETVLFGVGVWSIVKSNTLTPKILAFSLCALGISTIYVELGLRATAWAYHKWDPRSIDPRLKMSPYDNKQWAPKYFQESHDLQYEYREVIGWAKLPYKGEYINIDENGFRVSWDTLSELTRGKLLVFGGSTIYGEGSRDQYTIPSELAKLLNRRGFSCAVENCGQSGYVFLQEVLLLEMQLRGGSRPKYVIFYDGVNDTHFAYLREKMKVEPMRSQFNEMIDFHRAGFVSQLIHILRDALLQTKIFSVIKRIVPEGKLSHSDEPDQRTLVNTIETEYWKTFELLHMLSDKYAFKAFCFWQPVIFLKKQLSEEERNIDYYKKEARLADVFTLTNSHMTSNPERSFYNISNSLDNSTQTLFIDFCHLSEEGNNVIAQRIFETINPVLKDN